MLLKSGFLRKNLHHFIANFPEFTSGIACAHGRHDGRLQISNKISYYSITHFHFKFAKHAMNFCLHFQNRSCLYFWFIFHFYTMSQKNQTIVEASEFGIEMHDPVSVNCIQRVETWRIRCSWANILYFVTLNSEIC